MSVSTSVPMSVSYRKNKGSGVFHARFRIGPLERERSLGTKNERDAKDRTGEIRLRMRHIKDGLEVPEGIDLIDYLMSGRRKPIALPQPTVKALTLRQVCDDFLASYNAKEQNTRRTERIHAKHLCRVMGNSVHFDQINYKDLQAYVARRVQEKGRRGTVVRETIQKELATFRLIWKEFGPTGKACPIKSERGKALDLPKTCEKEPFKTLDEIRDIISGGVSPGKAAELWECLFLDTDQIRELLNDVKAKASHPFIYPLFVMAAYTGARRSELVRSEREHFHFKSGYVLVREKKRSKSAYTSRSIDLAVPLAQVMEDWFATHPGGFTFLKDGEPFTERVATHALRSTLKGTKWQHVRGWHTFRHSFASNLARSGKFSQEVIDRFLGHQTVKTRERYRHLYPDERKKTASALDSVFGGQ